MGYVHDSIARLVLEEVHFIDVVAPRAIHSRLAVVSLRIIARS